MALISQGNQARFGRQSNVFGKSFGQSAEIHQVIDIKRLNLIKNLLNSMETAFFAVVWGRIRQLSVAFFPRFCEFFPNEQKEKSQVIRHARYLECGRGGHLGLVPACRGRGPATVRGLYVQARQPAKKG
jgi:hypothetical protein